MKRKITELEQKLLDNGWYLANKRYTGKRSEKTLCYEYQKTSDLRNDNKVYDLFINLDLKRSQIVKYGVANLFIERMTEEELTIVRFIFLELRKFVESLSDNHDHAKDVLEYSQVNVPNSELDEKQELPPMTPEQFDELCQEMEKDNAKGS